MFKSGEIDEKEEDNPNPRYLTPCGRKKLRADSTTEDGINSSVRLDEEHLEPVIDRAGDKVLVYVEANNKWVAYDRATYTDRAAVGLPKKARRALDLDPDDTVEIWLDEWEESKKEETTDQSKKNGPRQQALSDPQVARDEYVWLLDDGPSTTYHHIRHDGGTVTVCGLTFADKEYRILGTRLTNVKSVICVRLEI